MQAAGHDQFGAGFTDDVPDTPIADSIPVAQEAMAGIAGAEHAVSSLFDPADGDSADDFDFNHDGVVDHHDARAALHSVHTFHVESPPEPDAHDAHDPSGLHESSGLHEAHDIHGPHDPQLDHTDPSAHHHPSPADHHIDLDFFHH